ncbi:toll-like receptor 13 [Haliotis cracherodii]|uniref:toll-like receptor 13 n=1 Tax=Haliotis cracherodii TaxID=6455 RepID=UPI0039ED4E0A
MKTLCVIILISLAFTWTVHGKLRKRCYSYCMCQAPVMQCRGKKAGIPKAFPNITRVELARIDLGYITRSMMANLTYCHLTSLTMDRNNITGIAPDAFQDLSFLQSLKWQQPRFLLKGIISALQNVHSDLQSVTLYADGGTDKTLNADVFKHLTSLRSMTLFVGGIEVFNASALSQVQNLSRLELSEHNLYSFILETPLPNLKLLVLKGNNLVEIPSLCLDGGVPLTPRLIRLDIQKNGIRSLDTSPLSCLPNLLKLLLSNNRIEALPDNAFANLPKLQSLHISNLLSLKSVEDLVFNSTSLHNIYYMNNPPFTHARTIQGTFFKFTPNLRVLNLERTRLQLYGDKLRLFLQNLRNIEKLLMQFTDLSELPSGVFSQLKKLRELNLLGNNFPNLTSGVFSNATSIQKLTLNSCNIKMIKEDTFPLNFRLSVKEIGLASNHFTCTCDLLWFRNWMKEVIANKSIKFSNYPDGYVCAYPDGKRIRLAYYNPTEKSCAVVKLYAVILTIALSVCLVFTVTALVVYRYRWHLLYWISLLRPKRRRQQRHPPEDMKYDAFVSYSNPDGDWVYDELLDFLEGEVGLRLCEHSRDFAAGRFIIDNVFDAMETSRKTILVISNEYMKSDWCKFELQVALSSHLKNDIEIAVILLEQIQPCHVTSTLRALMISTTYIEWKDEEEARVLFRQRIKNTIAQ